MIPRLVRALLAGAAVLALVVGVPTLLVLYGRSPLDGDGSLLDQISALPTQAISDNMAFGLLTIAAWVAWATFAQSVVVELANSFGSATRWRPLRWNPFELTARRLVTALTMTVSLRTSLGARAGSLPTLRPAAVEQPTASEDESISHARTMPAFVVAPTTPPDASAQVSSEVSGPTDVDPPAFSKQQSASDGTSPNPTVADGVPRDPALITVAPGDSPWALAAHHLGDGLRWRELWDLNRGVPQPDGRAWVTEDLIRPGWHLRLPAPPDELSPALPGDETASSVAPSPAPCPPAEDDQPGASDHGPAHDVETDGTSSTTSTPQVEVPSSPSHEPPGPDDGDSGLLDDLVPPLTGIAGATVVATSFALLLRRIRRKRSVRTARGLRRRGSRRSTQTEQAIASAADVPLVRWAGQALAAMMRITKPEILGGAEPVAVELSEDRGIELLWDRPVPDAVRPWVARDKGWAWSLSYDPDAPVPADQRTSPIPALVTVGDRQGRQLMIDIEAVGSISVLGDRQRVTDFGRAVALEIGADEDLADAYIATVGLDLRADEQLHRVTAATAEEALNRLGSKVAAVSDSLGDSAQASTFGHRIADDGAYLEATIVLVNVDQAINPRAFVEASPARRSVGTVLLGDAPGVGATIAIAADGMARIEPLGLTFRAASMPASTEQELADLLHAEASADDSAESSGSALQPASAGAQTNGAGNGAGSPITADKLLLTLPDPVLDAGSQRADGELDADSQDPDASAPAGIDWLLLVRVLGPPSVPDRPSLRRRELLVAVYLACRGRPVTPSSIQNAVWGGRAVEPKTFWNVVAGTRTALGALGDGSPVMPPNDRKSGTLLLSEAVVTDLALLQACYTHAQQLSSSEAVDILRRGLALIEGEPFNAPGYEWAYRDEQYVAEAAALIENAVLHLVQLATQAGDYGTAREAISQGLRGLPGNEVLYRARMRVEHAAGNIPGVGTAWNELVDFLLDLDMEPSDPTIALHAELTRSR